MERVQFQQEQMLAELKDLAQKGLFTQNETKQIMKKRTAFETALVRRIPKKADFLRYAAYEMGLEALRRKRVKRLGLSKSEPSISDYALVRRQFHIFERALKKFKGDVGLWVQYIQLAKKEGAKALVGRITARALQLHPNHPSLYILAAQHELTRLSPSAARALLQRGIRLNAESVEMWREYVRMEMGWIESVRRRWGVLGLGMIEGGGGGGKGKGQEKNVQPDQEDEDEERMQVDAPDEDESETARKAILEGAIVKAVICSAVKALPCLDLFTALHTLLITYPCPSSLRHSLLDHLYTLLDSTLPGNPGAKKLLAGRFLEMDESGEDADAEVEGVRKANHELAEGVRNAWTVDVDERKEGMERAYVEFVEEWCGKDCDVNLKLYLTSTLHSLIQHSSIPSPTLSSAHIRLLLLLKPYSNAKILRLARKYCATAKSDIKGKGKESTEIRKGWAEVWIARLQAEGELGSDEDGERAWKEAREALRGGEDAEDEVKRVWMWGVEQMVSRNTEEDQKIKAVEVLLKESMRSATALRNVHEELLTRYARLRISAASSAFRASGSNSSGAVRQGSEPGSNVASHMDLVRRVANEYLPTARVWASVFSMLSEDRGDEKVLEMVYEEWKRLDEVDACVEWARWLMTRGKGNKAGEVVMRGRGALGLEHRDELETRWRGILEERSKEEGDSMEE